MVVTGQPQVNIEHFKWGYCDTDFSEFHFKKGSLND